MRRLCAANLCWTLFGMAERPRECVKQSHLGKAGEYYLNLEGTEQLPLGRSARAKQQPLRAVHQAFVIGRKNFLFCITLGEPGQVPQPTASSSRPGERSQALRYLTYLFTGPQCNHEALDEFLLVRISAG